ncbi:MAG: hypothetical protein IPM54_06975 [Polyangiaceae bacterium]|nr:hypothetical protein [Polyangiaceae bacterium]
MKDSKAFWFGIACTIGGCTQLLDLDQEYRPGQTGTSLGTAGGAGDGGTGGTGGSEDAQANGSACGTANECASGFCIDGVCCSTACLDRCKECDVIGVVGTCVNVPLGQEDLVATTMCTGVNSCNGAGKCLLDNGQSCNNNGKCASGNCTGNPKTCQP